MSQWYVSKNGQALGPLAETKVREMIAAGEITAVDLVYKAGDSEWLPLAKNKVFANDFNSSKTEPIPVSEGETDWVLLKKVETDSGKEYKQLGPFSKVQVFQMIDVGDIQFTDFCWKEGMETWVKISEVNDFSDPLPSSTKFDSKVYEKAPPVDDVLAKTLAGDDKKASMTELVSIEHYEHQKTELQALPKKIEIEEDDDADKTTVQKISFESDEDNLKTREVRAVANMDDEQSNSGFSVPKADLIPLNTESFVTESGGNGENSTDLWSLKPPKADPKSLQDMSATEIDSLAPREGKDTVVVERPKKKKKPKKRKKPRKSAQFKNPLAKVDPEVWQWAVAVCAVVLGVFLFYKSFKVQQTAVVEYDESSELSKEIEAKRPKQIPMDELKDRLEAYRNAIKEARNSASTNQPEMESAQKETPPPPPPQNLQPKKQVHPQKAVAQARPSVQKVKKRRSQPEKVQQPSSPEKSQPEETVDKVAIMEKRSKIMRNSKKVTAPQVVKTTVALRVKQATGGAKEQSFYQQRDRLALFYSSLKAETLAVEITREFRKLRKSPDAWGRYYGQWRKRVRSSLARDIREFPKSSETYAYPKVLANFKKDYDKIYTFGETFDARAKGTRLPSGAPTDIKSVFSQYKKQAQELNR